MILVIGGYASGKKQWVEENLPYTKGDFTSNLSVDLPVLYNLQDLEVDNMEILEKYQVIICNEVGSGLVPIHREERHRRERTGRVCIALAKRASTVVRVVCGIGTQIKG